MGDAPKQPTDPDLHERTETPAAMSELYGRSLASVSKPGQPNARATFNVDNGLSGKAGEAGTFVTDRKKEHSFFQNVAQAFSEWRAMTAESLRRRHLIEEEPEKRITETVHDIMSQPMKQDVPHIAALRSETIAVKPVVTQPVTSEVALKNTTPVTTTATPPSIKETRSHTLQKIRTFKSDAAMIQANKTEAASATTVIQAPEPEPPKIAPAPKLPEKEIHVEPFDMRASTIAPEVNIRLNGTKVQAPAQIPEKPKEKDVVPIAPLILSPSEPATHEVETLPKASAPVIPEEVPQWTHVLDAHAPIVEEPPKEIKPVEPPVSKPETSILIENTSLIPTPPMPEVPPVLLNEDRMAHIEEKITRMRSETTASRIESSPLPVGPDVPFEERPLSELATAVEPEKEQESERISGVQPLAPAADPSVEKAPFHERIEAVHDPIPINENVSISRTHPLPQPAAKISAHPSLSLVRIVFRIMVMVMIIGVVIGGGAYLYLSTRVEPGVETPGPDVSDPGMPDTEVPDTGSHDLVLGEDTQRFRTDMKQAIEDAPSGLIELSVYAGEPRHVATTQEFLGQLDSHISARTLRALEPVFVIGSITTTHNEPFVLMRSNDFDTLFAGLLAWEPSMQQDLAPLFGDASTTTLPFSDTVRDNRPIRVLRDAADNEILVYSFIDAHTVVIAASLDALTELIKHF